MAGVFDMDLDAPRQSMRPGQDGQAEEDDGLSVPITPPQARTDVVNASAEAKVAADMQNEAQNFEEYACF